MLAGFFGIFVPLVPGVPLMLLGCVVYSWMTGWRMLSWQWLVAMAALTVISLGSDLLLSAWLTRRMGASGRAAAGSAIGTLVGVVVHGAYGALIGGIGGAMLGELSLRRPLDTALRAGIGAFLGFLAAILVDTIVGVAILAMFLYRAVPALAG